VTREELQQLYKEKILPENKSPYHFEKKGEDYTEVEAYNPMCGDKYKLYLQEDNKTIKEVYFHGIGCAISKASTSILLRKLEGLGKSEAIQFCKKFMDTIEQKDNFEELIDEELRVLAELKYFEGRMDCVQLSWRAILDYLK